MKTELKDRLFPRLLENAIKLEDDRGFIEILYESDSAVLKRTFSKAGVFRGMHLQHPPFPQDKIFRVVSGKIIDFITDPNDDSGQVWYNEVTPEDEWVHIDAKYAHGFYSPEDSVFEYFCDGQYKGSHEEAYSIEHLLTEQLELTDVMLSAKDADSKAFGKQLSKAPNTTKGE